MVSVAGSIKLSRSSLLEGALHGLAGVYVDMAPKWRKIYGPLQQRKEEKQSRQKLNLGQAKHFFEYLFGSNLIQDVAYGTTIIKYDSGQRQVLPHAVITTMRSHVIQEYKHYCQGQLLLQKGQYLSDSSLWRIIKPSQKCAMARLDLII